jgi:hypothetical protein
MIDLPHPRLLPPLDRHITRTSRLHVKKSPEDRFKKWLAKYDPQVVGERIKQSLEQHE